MNKRVCLLTEQGIASRQLIVLCGFLMNPRSAQILFFPLTQHANAFSHDARYACHLTVPGRPSQLQTSHVCHHLWSRQEKGRRQTHSHSTALDVISFFWLARVFPKLLHCSFLITTHVQAQLSATREEWSKLAWLVPLNHICSLALSFRVEICISCQERSKYHGLLTNQYSSCLFWCLVFGSFPGSVGCFFTLWLESWLCRSFSVLWDLIYQAPLGFPDVTASDSRWCCLCWLVLH